MVEWRNTVSGQVTGPVVQAARIDAVYLPGSQVPVDGPPLTEPVLPLRIPPARWLVIVDGLDEIIETDTRAQVIEAIAHRLRRTDQRLVITTRPLAGNELKPLERAGVERYEIQPFGPVELEEFALSWFQAQNRITARTREDELVRQVRDGRLRELVRNPLLATIAAIANTVEPDRQLPNSRVDLYERFMTRLCRTGGRTDVHAVLGSTGCSCRRTRASASATTRSPSSSRRGSAPVRSRRSSRLWTSGSPAG